MAQSTEQDRIDATRLAKRWARSTATLGRYVKKGLLAEPQYFNGRRVWFLEDVEAAEKRLAAEGVALLAARRAEGARLAKLGQAARKARKLPAPPRSRGGRK